MKRTASKKPLFAGWQDLLLDLVSCALVCVALNLVCMPQIAYPNPISPIWIILWPLFTLLFLALTTRRAWVLPAVLGGGILLSFATLLITGQFQSFLSNLEIFLDWLFSGLPLDDPYSTVEHLDLVQALAEIGIAALVFFCVRGLKRIYPAIIAFWITLIVYIFIGAKANYFLAVILLFAGSFPVAARDFYYKRNLFSFLRKRKVGLLSQNWRVQLTAGIVSLLCLLTSALILPQNTREWRFRTFTDLAADVQTSTNLFTRSQQAYHAPTPHELGLQPRRRLGGNIEFEDDTIVAVVQTDQPVLLKTTALEHYDGTMWSSEFKTPYRINGASWEEAQAEAFSTNLPSDTKLQQLLAESTVTQTISIMTTIETNTLASAGRVVSFEEETPLKDPILFNERGEIFTYAVLPEGYGYQIESEFYNFNYSQAAKLGDYLATLPKDAALSDTEFVNTYTALPENFDDSLVQFAKDRTAGFPTDLQKVVQLVGYFTDTSRFTYTDTPGPLPLDRELSLHLMYSKKGNSVYYATALALMARSLGIPSRVAFGFKASLHNETYDSIVARSCDAYAWVECYISNIGWVSFDPSPHILYNVNENEQDENSNISAPEPEPITPPEPEEPPEDEKVEDTEPEQPEKEGLSRFLKAEYLVPFLLLLALLYLLLRSLIAPRFYQPDRVKKRFQRRIDQVEYYYRDMLRQLKYLGLGAKVGDTTDELAARLAGHPAEHPAKEAFLRATALHYAEHPVADEADVALFAEAHLRAVQNPFAYWLFRRVLLPRHYTRDAK